MAPSKLIMGAVIPPMVSPISPVSDKSKGDQNAGWTKIIIVPKSNKMKPMANK
ncbi:hypothetical protein D3C87_1422610 [compost metagenome]